MKETKDWFTDECNSCGESLAKEGIVYVIHSSYVICQGCFENIKVYLIDIDVDEIHEDDCNCSDCVNDIMAGVAAMGPEDFE